MEKIYSTGLSGLVYTESDYQEIIRLYRTGMSISGIYHEYAKLHKRLNVGFSRIIVENAVMRYIERLNYWTKVHTE